MIRVNSRISASDLRFVFKVYRIRTRENRPSGDVSYLKGNQLDSASV